MRHNDNADAWLLLAHINLSPFPKHPWRISSMRVFAHVKLANSGRSVLAAVTEDADWQVLLIGPLIQGHLEDRDTELATCCCQEPHLRAHTGTHNATTTASIKHAHS